MTTADITMADVTALALRVVRDLLKDDELQTFQVSQSPPPHHLYPFPSDANLWLHVRAVGDDFFLPLTGDPSTADLEARLESNLQDWIAETKWGWGQQRVRANTPV